MGIIEPYNRSNIKRDRNTIRNSHTGSGGGGAGGATFISRACETASYIGNSGFTVGSTMVGWSGSSPSSYTPHQSQAFVGAVGQVCGASGIMYTSVDNFEQGGNSRDWFSTSPIESGVLCDTGRNKNLRGGKKMRAPYNDPKYFDSNGRCNDHRDYQCDDCAEKAESDKLPEITAVAIRQEKGFEADDTKKNFMRQAEFIAAALDLDDKQLDKIKVKDMASKSKEAADEITIGKMKKWLGVEKSSNPGFIGGAIQGFQRWMYNLGKKKVR